MVNEEEYEQLKKELEITRKCLELKVGGGTKVRETLVKIREYIDKEHEKDNHAFNKYTYPAINEILKEVGL